MILKKWQAIFILSEVKGMSNSILLEKPKENFINFNEKVEDFFLKRKVVINLYPNDISCEQEIGETFLEISSADQYYDYINREISFWRLNDPSRKLESIVYYNRFQNAKQNFDNALNSVHSSNYMENLLQQSLNSLSQGALSSKTNLAKILLEYINRSSNFISGFKIGMLINGTSSSMSTNSDTFQGFYAAMTYRKIFDNYILSAEEKITEFKSTVEEASKRYSVLNNNYTKSFLEQEKRLESITQQSNDFITELNKQSVEQFEKADFRLDNMEKVYREKLRLEAPAEYWAKLKKSYSKKGHIWFIISGIIAFLIITLLIVSLVKDIIIFSPEANWIENLKNSAIITVIASIGIYALRLTTKMGLSSYHLADDARERENLSYFYLSLIEKGAVTDNERALILNALFSRSDTGLLKGESSPSMPSNISDIIKIIQTNNT